MHNGARRFAWTSSVNGSTDDIVRLESRMTSFYANETNRTLYQAMLDENCEAPPETGRPGEALVDVALASEPRTVVEIGCGSGRVYRWLRTGGYAGAYSGYEVAPYVIARNKLAHPEAQWEVGTGYRIPKESSTVDLIFSYYVLEHCVRPGDVIREMVRVTRPGGCVLLVFPDFAASGRFGSQQCGITPGLARNKTRVAHWFDLIVTLYDSRVRLPNALSSARRRCGPFAINTEPLCLHRPDLMWADIDAVYIASKEEVAEFGYSIGCDVSFPRGKTGVWKDNAFLKLTKRR